MTKAIDESTEQRQSRLDIARKQAVKTREAKMIEKYRDKILSELNIATELTDYFKSLSPEELNKTANHRLF